MNVFLIALINLHRDLFVIDYRKDWWCLGFGILFIYKVVYGWNCRTWSLGIREL